MIFVGGKFLKFWSSITLSWGHVKSHTKFWPDRYSRVEVYLITNNRQAKDIHTRLLGRFVFIFYFNCEHFVFVWIVKHNKRNVGVFFKSWIFKIFPKSNFVSGKLLKIQGPKKNWAQSVQPFWRLLDTNKQTDIQTDK